MSVIVVKEGRLRGVQVWRVPATNRYRCVSQRVDEATIKLLPGSGISANVSVGLPLLSR